MRKCRNICLELSRCSCPLKNVIYTAEFFEVGFGLDVYSYESSDVQAFRQISMSIFISVFCFSLLSSLIFVAYLIQKDVEAPKKMDNGSVQKLVHPSIHM